MSEDRWFRGQPIGRLDDNGRELREGDLVRYVFHITHGPHEEGVGEVYYDDRGRWVGGTFKKKGTNIRYRLQA